jgi:hypothetical protein
LLGDENGGDHEEFVSHEYALADVDTAMQMSMNPQSLKVVMNPSLT